MAGSRDYIHVLYMHTRTHMGHTCIHVHTWATHMGHTCIHVHTWAIHAYTYMQAHVCTCMQLYTCMHVQYMHIRVCMYGPCVYVYIRVWMCATCVYVYACF